MPPSPLPPLEPKYTTENPSRFPDVARNEGPRLFFLRLGNVVKEEDEVSGGGGGIRAIGGRRRKW